MSASRHQLGLPQFCTPEQLAERKKQVDKLRGEYAFDHSWAGYPPSLKKLPLREKKAGEMLELAEAGLRIERTRLEMRARNEAYKLEHRDGGPPFGEVHALFDHESRPMIGDNALWQHDAIFASQRLSGMYPWFIRQVTELATLQRSFPVTNAMIEGIVDPGDTLAGMASEGRLYFVSQSELDGAPPAHEHVMTAPTTLFFINKLGQLMPLGIQLYPESSDTNPIFTPLHDPNTWLAAKIHASCADNLVHAIYSHAILMHFVMSNVWTAANRTLPPEHPIYAFLTPHFWATLFITWEVKASMDKIDGSQTSVYGTGLDGQNVMVSRLFKHFSFEDYVPPIDFRKRAVDSTSTLPEFYYRDDALKIWEADLAYVESMLGLFYENDEDVQNDVELQAWVAEMASSEGANIHGLPVNADGRIETRADLNQVVASVLFTVTSRHSSIENGALNYGYPAANPFAYRLAAPTNDNENLDLAVVSRKLPPMGEIIDGWALIQSANYKHKNKNRLGHYDKDFTKGWPAGAKQNVVNWRSALQAISAEIEARNKTLEIPYTPMNPLNTFNSIWN